MSSNSYSQFFFPFLYISAWSFLCTRHHWLGSHGDCTNLVSRTSLCTHFSLDTCSTWPVTSLSMSESYIPWLPSMHEDCYVYFCVDYYHLQTLARTRALVTRGLWTTSKMTQRRLHRGVWTCSSWTGVMHRRASTRQDTPPWLSPWIKQDIP